MMEAEMMQSPPKENGQRHDLESGLEEMTTAVEETFVENGSTKDAQSSNNSALSPNASIEDEHLQRIYSEREELIGRRFRHLARSFRERTQRVRNRFELPPTPSTVSSEPEDTSCKAVSSAASGTASGSQIMHSLSKEWSSDDNVESSGAVVEPQGCLYVTWLTMVTLSFLYNCFVIPLRTTFPYQTPDNTVTWLALDYSMDAFYLLDMALVKPRIMYLEDGFWVRDVKLTRSNYMRKTEFIMDIMSLVPLDLLYFYYGPIYPWLRIPRLLKIHTFWEFFNHFDKVSPSPYIVRTARTLTYMIYLVHLNACAYYAVSVNEGIASNHWVFNGVGNAYIRCFYFAVKTATSIGKNPRPENEAEYLFMTASWLMGVFVFAILIGQIRDIIATATRSQTEYRKLMDETLHHLRKLNLPPRLLERVKTWFSYTWQQQHTLDESRVLDTLPHKMKTDVAINVHIQTLNKVQLFKDCDEALLRELVLKLRPVLYLPGDYICRKGEVGKEMYIVKSGQVQVVTGIDGCEILATLTEGSVFGEISLLAISGGNRRTADVRSNGYSNLFVLSKDDLNEALQFHPTAQEILKKKAKNLVKQNLARERRTRAEVLIKNPDPARRQPKLLPIVMKVLPPDSGPARLLKYGSRCGSRGRNRRLNTTNNDFHYREKMPTRCQSLDLGMLGFLDREDRLEKDESTFQCNVTVHREMSK
ncbi:cyclic nucleotide-gated cation channel beta-1 [Cimex lectularius]|uniref:Cyclic nucleotide-binding domain-containing protein n=1 Tax=Cimex lectularius TaxID=79782 RepID=A0A8I6RXI7_CIMLE|nr:cyclic nucleotide-gated cation channel beta-1 [Cimex lectularius]